MKLHVPIPKPRWYNILLRVAAVLTLLALALMCWSVLQPTPLPVLLAMSAGQGLGIMAFAMFGLVVFADLRRHIRLRKPDEIEATEASPEAPIDPAVAPSPSKDTPS